MTVRSPVSLATKTPTFGFSSTGVRHRIAAVMIVWRPGVIRVAPPWRAPLGRSWDRPIIRGVAMCGVELLTTSLPAHEDSLRVCARCETRALQWAIGATAIAQRLGRLVESERRLVVRHHSMQFYGGDERREYDDLYVEVAPP